MKEYINIFIFILVISFAICLICVYINNQVNEKIAGGVEKLTKEIIKKPSEKFINNMKKLMGGYNHKKLFIDTFSSILEKTHDPIEKTSDIKYKLPFMLNQESIKESGTGILKYGKHIGQRKLFLNEVQILIKARDYGYKILYICWISTW